MKIGILGTGTVGQTLGSKLIEIGHEVMMGSRTHDNPKALSFVEQHAGKALAGSFADTAGFGSLLINCTSGAGTMDALKMAGEANLRGKVLIDVSNPLDFSQGMPPVLSVVNTGSLGEMIQQAYPEVKVVKTLNTMWCGLMVNPGMINDGNHHVFVSGNDAEAKQEVSLLLQSFGWKTDHILDLGDISTARGTEMYLPLWLRVWGAKQSAAFNIQIVS